MLSNDGRIVGNKSIMGYQEFNTMRGMRKLDRLLVGKNEISVFIACPCITAKWQRDPVQYFVCCISCCL
jgi:hypothetical protein